MYLSLFISIYLCNGPQKKAHEKKLPNYQELVNQRTNQDLGILSELGSQGFAERFHGLSQQWRGQPQIGHMDEVVWCWKMRNPS